MLRDLSHNMPTPIGCQGKVVLFITIPALSHRPNPCGCHGKLFLRHFPLRKRWKSICIRRTGPNGPILPRPIVIWRSDLEESFGGVSALEEKAQQPSLTSVGLIFKVIMI